MYLGTITKVKLMKLQNQVVELPSFILSPVLLHFQILFFILNSQKQQKIKETIRNNTSLFLHINIPGLIPNMVSDILTWSPESARRDPGVADY